MFELFFASQESIKNPCRTPDNILTLSYRSHGTTVLIKHRDPLPTLILK